MAATPPFAGAVALLPDRQYALLSPYFALWAQYGLWRGYVLTCVARIRRAFCARLRRAIHTPFLAFCARLRRAIELIQPQTTSNLWRYP